jgi:RHS repeat-associated protein
MGCSSPVSVNTGRLPSIICSARARHASRLSRILWAVAIFLISGAASANAGTFTVFGPQNYARGTGAPVTVTSNFSVLNPNTQYTLKVFNGGLQDNQTELVSSGFVTINGVQVIGPSNFNQNVVEVDVPVTLQATNTIDVQVRGKQGGVLTVEIVGLDNDPPLLSITSPANGVTVSTSSVLVTGTVSDALSGVAAVTCNGAPATVQSGSFSCTVALTSGANTITVTATDGAGNSSSATENITFSNAAAPTITSFSPTSGPIGTEITLTGSNFSANGTSTPQVALRQQSGGNIGAPVASFTTTSISFVIPAGATSGPVTVTVSGQSATSAASLSVVASSSFSVSAGPTSASVQQGTSTAYSVSLSSTSGFSQLASLSVSGVPTGVTTKFSPPQITAGQSSILTVTAPAGQTLGNATLTISASATVDGIPATQSASVGLSIQTASTSLIGRTVESDNNETPIPGIVITMLGVDDAGKPTGCSGQTRSDAAGNFAFTNLGTSCLGRQLVSYDGNTSSDGEKYAGVNLAYTMVAGQVTGPELVHMPTISDAETIMVQQNASVDQTFSYSTIPGVTVTVYAGTTLTMPDGTQPNPFPMAAVLVPVDRLPDAPSPTAGTLRASIVAFQPANTTSSLPVSVTFPNVVNTPPGVNMELDTLDPIVGELVKYGTGTVSADATEIVPDPDPAHPGHRFGISHFDWHGPMAPAPNGNNPCPNPPCAKGGDPVDLSSGLLNFTKTDVSFGGARGRVSIQRTYRTLSGAPGPFGVGTNHNYGYELDVSNLLRGTGTFVTLVMPDGNQLQFVEQGANTFVNSTIPRLLGSVITSPASGTFNLRWKNGTVFRFQTSTQGALLAFLNSITDANGNTVTLVRGNSAQPVQITQIIDPVGRTLNLTYDNFNRILSLTDPIGRTLQYTYNAQGTLATVTDPAEGVTSYAYDPQNRMTSITDPRSIVYLQNVFDANGRVIQQTAADGGVTKFAYTLINPSVPTSPVLLTTVTDPRGNATTYHFNPQGFVIDTTDALGEKTIYNLDPGTNNVLSSTDPLNRVTTYTYDDAGNITSVTRLAGTPNAVTTSYSYDPTFSQASTITDGLGHVTTFKYDTAGNVTSITDPLNHQITFTYDSNGELLTTTDAVGNTTRSAYVNGDLVRVTDPLNRTTTRSMDAIGRLTAVTNALGQTTKFQYSPLGQTTQVVDAKGQTTSFQYDGNGNLLVVTDANQHSTSFSYDKLDRIATRTDPLGKVESYQYDLAGNPSQFADRRGIVSTFTFDALNRKTHAAFGTDSSITYAYDAASRLIQAADSAAGTLSRTYDGLDRMISETTPEGSVTYGYDAAGRRTTMAASGQATINYAYDDANRLSQITQGTRGVSFTFDADNRAATVTLPNGVVVTYNYDAASQVTGINYTRGAITLGNLSYTYDLSGRGITNVGGSFARIALPAALANSSYNADNQVTQFAASNLSYDANGNIVGDGVNTYVWNSRNQLAAISGGVSASFQYDVFGRRTVKQIGTNNVSYLYDGDTPIAQLSGGAVIASTLSGGLDRYFERSEASGSSDFLPDMLGSTLALTDSSGGLQTQYTYEPFGNTSFTGSASTNPFQFTGRENDGTGLYFNRARYYSPTLQRFISEDPILFSGGSQNLYAYAFNNPLRFSDTNGRCPWCIVAGIGAAVGAAVEGYKAYECGARGWDLAGAIGRGAVAGGVGAVAGLGVGLLTGGNPFAAGAAAGFSNDVVKYALGGGGSVQQTVVDTVVGGAFGVAAEALGPEVNGGQNFNPFTSPNTFGPKATQAYAQEAIGDAFGAGKDLSGGEGGDGGGDGGGDTSGRKNKSGCK